MKKRFICSHLLDYEISDSMSYGNEDAREDIEDTKVNS